MIFKPMQRVLVLPHTSPIAPYIQGRLATVVHALDHPVLTQQGYVSSGYKILVDNFGAVYAMAYVLQPLDEAGDGHEVGSLEAIPRSKVTA